MVARIMEVDAKLREAMAPQSQHPLLLSNQNILKNEFPFETCASSSKGTSCYNLLEFHHLEHHQVHVNGSSLNPVSSVQTTTCYDLFDAFPYGSSSTNNADFSYECKPFAADNNIGEYSQVMDSFDDFMGSFDFQETVKPVNLIVHDELSCVTSTENGYYKNISMNKNRLLASTRKSWRGRKNSNVVKGQWTAEEDRLLIQLVEQYGIKKWCIVAQMLPGRIGKQCRERWHNHLRPNIKKDTWNEEEDKVLIQAHIEIGNKWAEIAKRLPGRTENSIKNHWNATKRRQLSRRRTRSKYSKGSILQEYIKSLNFDQSGCNNNSGRSFSTNMEDIDIASTTKQVSMDFVPTDRLVPEYDFNQEIPDFCFVEKMIQESCSVNSLLDEISSATEHGDDDDAKKIRFQINKPLDIDSAQGHGMAIEVKKEMDLVEIMMSQQPD